jgi:hypothetical protein
MANGEARAANGLPRHLIPLSISSIHEGEIHMVSSADGVFSWMDGQRILT